MDCWTPPSTASVACRRRVWTQFPPWDEGGCEVDTTEVVAGELVVSSSDLSPVLEAAPHAFDPISLSIGESVVGDRLGAGSGRGDDGLGLSIGKQTTQMVRIVSAICDEPSDRPGQVEQRSGDGDVVDVAGRQ